MEPPIDFIRERNNRPDASHPGIVNESVEAAPGFSYDVDGGRNIVGISDIELNGPDVPDGGQKRQVLGATGRGKYRMAKASETNRNGPSNAGTGACNQDGAVVSSIGHLQSS